MLKGGYRYLLSGLTCLCGAFVLLTWEVSARWIVWQAGIHEDSGKVILSADGSWNANGLPQIYHFWKKNFETVIVWRQGDLLAVDPVQQQLLYTLGSDAEGPLAIEFRLSHFLGAGPLEYANGTQESVPCRVFIGEIVSQKSRWKPNRVSFGLSLFKGTTPVTLKGDGIEGSGWSFSRRPPVPVGDASESSKIRLVDDAVTGTPPSNNHKLTHLYGRSFDEATSRWDRVVFTLMDYTGSGFMRKGTTIRILLSGAPLERSTYSVPATCDPLGPIVLHDPNSAFSFRIPKVTLGPRGSCVLESVSRATLVDRDTCRASLNGDWLLATIGFRDPANPPAINFLNLTLEADSLKNIQSTVVLTFDRFKATTLSALLDGPWLRRANRDRPEGRPLWESSMALCDKIASAESGISVPSVSGTLRARHMNQRKVLLGSLRATDGIRRPAFWNQNADGPTVVDEAKGQIEGANDRLQMDLVGYRVERGINRPVIWQRRAAQWQATMLPCERTAIGGRALDINDSGIVCGDQEILGEQQSHRLPCLWQASDSGHYQDPMVLPVPHDAVGGAAIAINDSGTVAGYYKDADDRSVACCWQPEGSAYRLIDLGTFGVVRGINQAGLMVGGSDVTAYLWQSGKRFDLAEIEGAPKQSRALGILSTGDVLVKTTDRRTLLLSPVTALEL